MTQPDPEFLDFFAGEWQRLLEATEIPGMNEPSWDRRAAYLLWLMGWHYDAETPWHWHDVLMGHVIPAKTPMTGRDLRPINWNRVMAKPETDYGRTPSAPIVGINHADDDNCAPDPEGVSFHFDAVKVSGEK